MSKNKKITISSVILIFLILFGVFFLAAHTIYKENSNLSGNTPPPNLPLNKGEEKGGGQSSEKTVLQINGVSYKDEIAGAMSVYDFMSQLRSEGKINFTEKNYAGMGEFIESIDGIQNNSTQGWIYYVNGKEAGVGVSNYKINPGDVVSWKYEKSNY